VQREIEFSWVSPPFAILVDLRNLTFSILERSEGVGVLKNTILISSMVIGGPPAADLPQRAQVQRDPPQQQGSPRLAPLIVDSA